MVNGPDNVQQIYPTKAGGTEFYINMNDPYIDGGAYTSLSTSQFRITYGKANKFPFTTTNQSGANPKFFNTTGSPISYASGSPNGRSVRLDIFPDGGWNADNTNYSYSSNPGYLYTNKGIQNGEFTVYIRGHGDL